ncbi:MAG: hypothetical protein DCF22_19560 [Leptolyngbya sp.]|nr:MAG: hypothetical protein DCF22_19560 [Leptolyngbya sp.]
MVCYFTVGTESQELGKTRKQLIRINFLFLQSVVLFLKGWRIIAVFRELAREGSQDQAFFSVLYVRALPFNLVRVDSPSLCGENK